MSKKTELQKFKEMRPWTVMEARIYDQAILALNEQEEKFNLKINKPIKTKGGI